MIVRASTPTTAKPAEPAKRPVLRRRTLCHLIAVALAATAMSAQAGTPPAFSQAWLAQKQGQPSTPPVSAPASSGDGSNGGVFTPASLLQQKSVQQSIANLNAAAQAVATQMAQQKLAADAAGALPSPIPNGLATGGLKVAAGAATDPSLWQNANAPTQSVSGGQTTVEVTQTDKKAILTWDSFNVGRNTTLYFNQSAGNQSDGSNDWIALNRINDPSASPSKILGQIKAEGTVYLLNRNGFVFGAGSVVNTHSLLASSLDLFSGDLATSDSTFLNSGITEEAAFLVDGAFTDGLNHDVVVEKGASITTGAQGFALLAAPNVSNAGSIVSDDGQAILAAGIEFGTLSPEAAGAALSVVDQHGPFDTTDYPAGGLASNTGLIQARRGQVHMLGYDVDQGGVALASTSISHPGSIDLNARDDSTGGNPTIWQRSGTLNLLPGSVTAVLPEKDGTTTSSTPAANAAFVTGNVTLAGGLINFQAGSLVEAPGANVSVIAQVDMNFATGADAGRVYVDTGAIIDVSGLADIELPMSALLVSIPRIGQNELADSPLLRNSFLYTQQNVLIDSSQSGARTDGLDWIGSPILNVAGYVDNVPRDISQMLTKGGSIDLSGYEVIVRTGAQLHLDGGYLAYQPGWITTPNLLSANGTITNIADADPDVDYVGFAGQYTSDHARWGVTETFNSPLLGGTRRWDPGFIIGSDAGSLSVEAENAMVLDGDVSAHAYAGRNQVAQDEQPAGGTLNLALLTDTRFLVNKSGYASGLLLQQSSQPIESLDPTFQADTPWQAVLDAEDPDGTNAYDLRRWLKISADMIGQAGISKLNLSTVRSRGDMSFTNGQILEQPGTTLSVAPGGSINMTGTGITVLGQLVAPAGAITLTSVGPVPGSAEANGQPSPGDITIGNGAVLSTRGLWVNDTGQNADDILGDHYINGGSISLVAEQSVSGGIDDTGSLLLEKGSLLDVSSGGYVGTDGVVRTANGVPVGRGGDISLITYADSTVGNEYGNGGPGNAPPTQLDSGKIELGGEILAFGFSGGGGLTLKAAELQIGGDPTDMALVNGLYLDPGFFAGQGFDNYALTSVTDAIVSSGASVRLGRDNYLPNYAALSIAPTGTDLVTSGAVVVGQLDPYQRYVTRNTAVGQGPGFSLSAGEYLNWNVNPQAPPAVSPTYAGVTGSVFLGDGASIFTDAGSTVSLGSAYAIIVDGTVSAPGGNIDLLVSPSIIKTQLPREVWLGDHALLDAAGVALIDPDAVSVSGGDALAQAITPRTGLLLAGGSVSLAGADGYVLTAQGSRIDVSGVADTFDLPTMGKGGLAAGIDYVASPVWSNAGSIFLSASAGLYADGDLSARGGSDQAEGGTLEIAGLNSQGGNGINAQGILLQQSGYLLPAGLQPGDAVEQGGPSGILHFAVDRLTNSGISSVVIGPDQSSATPTGASVPVGFAGDVNLILGHSFSVEAPAIIAMPEGSTGMVANTSGYVQGNGTVSITAPYVNLTGISGSQEPPLPAAGDGVLDIHADFINLGGTIDLQQWAKTNFTSTGDIRFYLPPGEAYRAGAVLPGELFTTGDLSFQAAQLYPVSDYPFAIVANGDGLKDANGNALSTTLTILSNGNSTVPLSAGGALLFDADTIEQEGAIRVPSGSIVLGVQDPAQAASDFGFVGTPGLPLVSTQSVHLAPGSITSVSLEGSTIPFGTTTDGTQWSYNGDPASDSAVLNGPPEKSINIAGANVSLDAGATINLSGGGHLQAEEWVSGTGGSRDVLSQFETSFANSTAGTQVPQYADGRPVYAILPGYTAPVGAHDAALEKGAGDGPAVGESVYLSGIAGLPAGMYTLLPAKYATLPGAFRVVQDTGVPASALGANSRLPDGTLSVTGYFADALNGARDATNSTFLVQPESVWGQDSQYTISDAGTYFTTQAGKAGTVVPNLPDDGGHLQLSATAQLDLGATLTGDPAAGGRGSMVDIAAQAIQVVGADEAARTGYLQLSADDLTRLGAGSLLLGGTRQLTSDGYTIDSIADSVVLDNDSAHPLAGQEILLVANGDNNPGAQGVLLDQGSSIVAQGAATSAAVTPINFGREAGTDASGNALAAVSGDGALLRVSQNGAAVVTRYDVSDNASGLLTIKSGATVNGGAALTLDTTGSTVVDPLALFSAKAIDANSNAITFIGADGGAGSDAAGLVIGPGTLNLLRGAQDVTLRSRGTIDFIGDVDVDLSQALNLDASAFTSDGGKVTIEAGTLGLGNALGTTAPAFAAGTGQLTLNVGELDFTSGKSTLQGFGSFSATASQGMAGQGTGSIDFGNLDVTLNTPLLMAESGANTTLTTTGALAVNGASGTPLQRESLGGALSLTGGTVTVTGDLEAPAGSIDLHATSGDLTVAIGGSLDASGVDKTFFDTTAYAPGGDITLTADNGAVNVQKGAAVNFAGGSQGGDAGSLTIDAGTHAVLNGSFDGHAVQGYNGGYFVLTSGEAVDLDQVAALTAAAGTTGAISINSGAGNLLLSSGNSLVAGNVYLVANGGTGGPNADAGNVIVNGTVNVSGAAAGNIQLYGRSGVDVEGNLLATSSVPEQYGGNVVIGTTGTGDGTLNGSYGYENVQAANAGLIHLGAGARIDVSGGSADAGGTLSLRAPLLANGDVPIAIDNPAVVIGARNITIEPYATWSTTDKSTDPAKHFDGLIDPAGWYTTGPDGTPVLVAGTWTDATGATLPAPTDEATLNAYLSVDYFTPTNANTDHGSFYGYLNGDANQGPGALMGYVEQPGYSFGDRFAGLSNGNIRPGIDLVNPDASINAGNISVLTNWNLGAGTTDANGTVHLAYRYQPTGFSGYGEAPVLSLLAQNNLDIKASLSDGFYQQNNGPTISVPPTIGGSPEYTAALNAYQKSNDYLLNGAIFVGDVLWQSGQYFTSTGGGEFVDLTLDQYYKPLTAPAPGQSNAYYANYQQYIGEIGDGDKVGWAQSYNNGDNTSYLGYNPTQKTAPNPASFSSYADYVSAYQNWLMANFGGSQGSDETPSPLLVPLQSEAVSNYGAYSADYGNYINGFTNYYTYVSTQVGSIFGGGSQLFYAPWVPALNSAGLFNNGPSNMPSLGIPASLASATLLGGSSASYRLVAGADLTSVDPLAVRPSVASGSGNVNLDGHFAVADTTTVDQNGTAVLFVDGKTLVFPTTVRTGTGSIDVASAGDIDWLDHTAPAVIYTAGEPAQGTSTGTGVIVARPIETTVPDFLVTDPVNPEHAGDISLSAQGSINAIQQVYTSTSAGQDVYVGQFWWPWMQTGNAADGSRSSINFANFDQGVMSVGGNVNITAGGDIRELSVSLPTTWYANADGTSVTTVGGGDLNVRAGGDILSGSYFVAKGRGSLQAGGLIGSDFDYIVPDGIDNLSGISTPVSTILGLQDAQWDVQARQGVDLGGIFNPSYGILSVSSVNSVNGGSFIPAGHFDGQSYSPDSSVSVTTSNGSITLDSLSVPALLLGFGSQAGDFLPDTILPSTLNLTSLEGDVNVKGPGGLYPSATGNLNILANGSVNFSQQVYSGAQSNAVPDEDFGLIDASAALLPSPLQPYGSENDTNFYKLMLSRFSYLDDPGDSTDASVLHQQAPLHGDDYVPVRIYALTGDVVDGTFSPDGFQVRQLIISPDKQALVYGGRDIVDLSFQGQHTHAADITRIAAGRDIYDTPYSATPVDIKGHITDYQVVEAIVLGGPGSLLVEAGRNIGPLTNRAEISANTQALVQTGIDAVGNANDTYLPHESADINVLFGVGPGIDSTSFIARYLDTPGGVDGFGSLLPDLVDFMQQRDAGSVVDTGYAKDRQTVTLTDQEARDMFGQLPDYVQRLFIEKELFKMLAQVGADYNNPASAHYLQYQRGYTAIDTLFPASLGYTANGSGQGGLNGAAQTVDTGDLDIRSSTIQTQQGGNITILGPGGQALIGSASAPPVITDNKGAVVAGPNSMGILTLEQGGVNILTDRSLVLAQSRIFTEQGGDMVIWSSNGDINAGQGAKTTAELPPPSFLCTIDAWCRIDAKGEVSGAGIATLQTIPGAADGSVYLIAPRGTVDAGDAGIRVSGNLIIAAARVANADNIQVQGEKIGVPVTAAVNIGALNAAGSAASAASKVADDVARKQQNDARDHLPSVISVQVLGVGDDSTSVTPQPGSDVYDPSSPVQVLGAGRLSATRKASLTEAERSRLSE